MNDSKASDVVNRVWNYAHVLRDDGVGYGDYIEQITFLIFLKMADERDRGGQTVAVPQKYSWSQLVKLDGDALEIQYRHTLEELGKKGGMLGTIFRKAQNKIQDPAKLERLIKMIEKEAWSTLPLDVKGNIYEGLLERNAQDVRGGAGQYFTPRHLIEAIVEVMKPDVMDTVADPACGTGGFLLAAYDYMKPKAKGKKEQKHLNENALRGNDIVDSVTRLCAMNLYLHGIGSADGDCPVVTQDALAKEVSDHDRVDLVLANPPFGKKSSVTVINEKTGKAQAEKLTYERTDFWATTSNKQLNFVQHIANMLKINGKAAVVVPDNVLFEGGAGETIRKNLLDRCNLHTILRLPTGIFYAQGVKANVIFFDAKPAAKKAWTQKLWVYDYRTNVHKTLKQNRLSERDFEEFIECYSADDLSKREESEDIERWKAFSYEELIARDRTSLDIFWLKDDSLEDTENLPSPQLLAVEIVEQLEAALEEFRSVEESLLTKTE
ncbi:DNA methyltransferase [Marinobacter guineae]|uniref:site-specific DNA-methyltransferase (adenine-specific) n=1 Tax=Marinobacter guineae TaxID=432303 RepID=A0A2G1VK80_9GAMM|nr:class I SAM-dependent DNA methyltransferase [Marinobacter guineae]PHQ27186.1 DNA methyltransferase [Marinobacter guineae]